MKEKLLDWFRLGRWHTTPATVILLVSSYVAGGGSLFSLMGLLLFLYGLLNHWTCFGHNVVMDYWWDLEDPSKSHHPLTAGRIRLEDAVNVVNGLLGVCLLIGLLFAWGNWWSLFWFAMFIAGGFLYNNWLSKTTVWGWVPITVCYTSLSIYAMGLAGGFNLLYALYIMFTIWFQIGWSGYLKEIEVSKQANLLRRLGAGVEDGWFRASKIAKLFGAVVKLGNFCLGVVMLYYVDFWRQVIGAFLLVAMWAMLDLCVLRNRKWDRLKELKNMSLMEIVTIYLGMFLVMPLAEALVLAGFGLAWFTLMNKYLWRTKLIPRV